MDQPKVSMAAGERTAARGFSMLELMIVLFVLAVLAAVSVPNLEASLGARSAAISGDEFAQTHSLARAAAMQYGRTASLRIDPASGRFWVQVTDPGTLAADTVGVVHDVTDRRVTLRSTRTTLCYDARGLAVAGGGCDPSDAVVTFVRSGSTDTVVITATGRLVR